MPVVMRPALEAVPKLMEGSLYAGKHFKLLTCFTPLILPLTLLAIVILSFQSCLVSHEGLSPLTRLRGEHSYSLH